MARKSRKNLPQPEQATVSVQFPELDEEKIPTAIYGRLSVEDDEDNESMETQIALVQDFINRSSELNYVDTYFDNGFTGTNFKRPAFTRLMNDVRQKKIKCIVVKDLSRFGRNYGKSTMMMNLIAELSTGGKTPDGCKIGAPQKVIYQCSEDGVSDTIKPRLERCGADCRKIAFINEEVYNGLTLDDERIRQAIIEFRPRLVVIDPIQAYLGSDSDLQIAGRARKLMRRLGMWAAGYDCAIVLIGHLNKKEGSKGLYRSLGSIDVVAAARSVLQVERDTENPDIRIVHQIKNSLAPTAEDIRFSISADKGFRWLECRPQLFEKQQPDAEPKFDTEQQKAAYWIKHFLEKGDMSANEIYCRLDNEGVSKRVARMVKTEMGIHCYQKKRRWYWSVQPEEGAMNESQV